MECNAMGAQLSEATSEADLDMYGDFTPTRKMQKLLPSVDYKNTPIEMIPLFLVQLTKFPCGGLCVGVLISHTLVDGSNAVGFVNSWASFARGEKLKVEPYLDRTILIDKYSSPRFPHIEFDPLPLLIGCSDESVEREKETKVEMLKVSKDQVEQLKKIANQGQTHHGRPYSRYEAVTGHLWRSACKARGHKSNQPTIIRFMVESRNRLQPPLPPGYFGCTALPTVTPSCLSGDLVSKPLGYAADQIRQGTEMMTNEYIRSSLGFLAREEDISKFRTSFHIVGSSQGFFSGNPNLSITSWTHLPTYEADFGWGKPIHVGPALVNSDGKVFILSGCDGDGSLAIALRLQAQHMDSLRRFFYQDIIKERAVNGKLKSSM